MTSWTCTILYIATFTIHMFNLIQIPLLIYIFIHRNFLQYNGDIYLSIYVMMPHHANFGPIIFPMISYFQVLEDLYRTVVTFPLVVAEEANQFLPFRVSTVINDMVTWIIYTDSGPVTFQSKFQRFPTFLGRDNYSLKFTLHHVDCVEHVFLCFLTDSHSNHCQVCLHFFSLVYC